MSHYLQAVFTFKTLQLQKENSPRRGGSFLCDQEQGSPCPAGMWPCMDTDSSAFEDRPLSKLKESDRCSARENLYLDTLSLDDESEEPLALGPQREFRNCFREVSLGLGLVTCRTEGEGLGSWPSGCILWP